MHSLSTHYILLPSYVCIVDVYRRPCSGLPVTADVHCIIGELQSIVVIAPNRGTTLQRLQLQLQLQLRQWFIIILRGGRCNVQHYALCAIPSRLFILLLSSRCLTLICYQIRPTDPRYEVQFICVFFCCAGWCCRVDPPWAFRIFSCSQLQPLIQSRFNNTCYTVQRSAIT